MVAAGPRVFSLMALSVSFSVSLPLCLSLSVSLSLWSLSLCVSFSLASLLSVSQRHAARVGESHTAVVAGRGGAHP